MLVLLMFWWSAFLHWANQCCFHSTGEFLDLWFHDLYSLTYNRWKSWFISGEHNVIAEIRQSNADYHLARKLVNLSFFSTKLLIINIFSNFVYTKKVMSEWCDEWWYIWWVMIGIHLAWMNEFLKKKIKWKNKYLKIMLKILNLKLQ